MDWDFSCSLMAQAQSAYMGHKSMGKKWGCITYSIEKENKVSKIIMV